MFHLLSLSPGALQLAGSTTLETSSESPNGHGARAWEKREKMKMWKKLEVIPSKLSFSSFFSLSQSLPSLPPSNTW